MKIDNEVFGGILIGIIAFTAIVLCVSWPFMLLWNWLMPMIFGLPELTFLQSAGLLLLLGFVFGSSKSS